MRIEATTNARVKAVRRLHRSRERRQTRRTIVEGPKLIEAALDAGIVPLEVYTMEVGSLTDRCASAGSHVFEVSRPVIETVSTTVEPQDCVGVIAMPESAELQVRRTAVGVEISDPGNAGTLIRTAAALGWQIAFLEGADPWNPKVLRASAGAQLSHPAVHIQSTDDLSAAGLTLVAATVDGGLDPADLEAELPIALLIGSEAHGLSEAVVDSCKFSVTIPMSGATESLNAAAAGAIAMYALGRLEGTSSS